MPTIRIPKPFRRHTGGEANVPAAGSTVGEALDELLQRYPALRSRIYDDNGNLITSTDESVNVLLNKHDVRELKGNDTPLNESARLIVLRTWPAAISGGQRQD
jgi:molybdopterin converting factor small subunit